MKFTIERNWIDVLGHIWMPNIQGAMRYSLSSYDIDNIRNRRDEGITRENIEDWLGCNAGDFQSIDDFSAVIGEETFAWQEEDNECKYLDCMYPSEDA